MFSSLPFVILWYLNLPLLSSGKLLITVPPWVELQPKSQYGDPCHNVSVSVKRGCYGGWHRLNAYVRSYRNNPNGDPVALLYSIDHDSHLIQSHPMGLSLNHAFFARSGGDTYNFEHYVLYEVHDERPISFAKDAPVLLTDSNNYAPSFYIAPAITRYTIVQKPGGHVLAFFCMHLKEINENRLEESSVLKKYIPVLKRVYGVTVVVVKIIDSDSQARHWKSWLAPRFVGLGVDIVIGKDASLTNGSRVTTENGTTYVELGKDYKYLTMMEWDGVGRRVTNVEVTNIYDEELPASMLSDPEYARDVQFLQTKVSEAESNDPVIGTATSAVPDAEPACRYQECEQGNFWADAVHDSVPNSEIVALNADSFKSGWEVGPFTLGALYRSNIYADRICSFDIWGADVWTMFNSSVGSAPESSDSYDRSGRFLQVYGVRIRYNPHLPRSPTRLLSIDIRNPKTGEYEPLNRRRRYTVAMNSFLCRGGYVYTQLFTSGIGNMTTVDVDIRSVGVTFVTKNRTVYVEKSGRIVLDSTADVSNLFVMDQISKTDCGENRVWIPEVNDCEECPLGTRRLIFETSCSPYQTSSNTLGILLGSVIGSCAVILNVAIAFVIWSRRKNPILPPEDDVTILFTDIESSSDLWAAYPDDMGAVIEKYHGVIRSCIRRHQCYEVKTIGDAFMVACGSSGKALELACDIQEELYKTSWPDFVNKFYSERHNGDEIGSAASEWNGLRVRIGMHTGGVNCQNDIVTDRFDYYGSGVNLSARVESSACGGQVLCTDATWTLAKPELEASGALSKMHVTELGERKFKGIPVIIQVIQILPNSLSQRTFPDLDDCSSSSVVNTTLIDEVDHLSRKSPDSEKLSATKQSVTASLSSSSNNSVVNTGGSGGGGGRMERTISAVGSAVIFDYPALEAERQYFAIHNLVVTGRMTEENLYEHLVDGLRWLLAMFKPIQKSQRKKIIAEIASAWKVHSESEDRNIVGILLRIVEGASKGM